MQGQTKYLHCFHLAILFDIKGLSRFSALNQLSQFGKIQRRLSKPQVTNKYAFMKQISETRSCQNHLFPFPRSNTSELPVSQQIIF